ncbi:MAG: hypothetical protein CENE_02657 [Candidatus Celerinatantimonas neptuna]|nr:MAG: hypothetical protein CENE_02657 [Candidatus Celerinatantimonas neptuna]
MTIESYNYDQPVSGDTQIEHVDITIAKGENVKQYTPVAHDADTGHFKAVAATDTSAQFLTSFAVDASTAAVAHRAIKAMDIDPDFVAWPDKMTEAVKTGLFAGTPISIQSPRSA